MPGSARSARVGLSAVGGEAPQECGAFPQGFAGVLVFSLVFYGVPASQWPFFAYFSASSRAMWVRNAAQEVSNAACKVRDPAAKVSNAAWCVSSFTKL